MKHDYGTIQQERTQEVLNLWSEVEGEVTCYYGRIRNGKTYSATADILELLERGEVVYANWYINFDDYDERESFFRVILKFFSGRKFFYKFKKENFHYFHPDEIDVAFLGKLVNVNIFIDEGQWIFNSHIKDQDPEKRKLILHNGHYCRSLNIITQRPINIFKDMRSQVNAWYRCEKKFQFGGILLFSRTRIEDMVDDLPDEENPVGRPKIYFASKRVLNAYSTHAMRSDDAIEMLPDFEVFETTFWDRFRMVFSHLVPFGRHGGSRATMPKKLRVKNEE